MEHKHSYIVFDVETSGLSAGTIKEPKSIIMEFAAIAINEKLEEVDRLEFYIQPYSENPSYQQGALDTHNIPISKTESDGITSKEAVSKIIDFFKKYSNGARKKPILGGHNIVKFDNNFMNVLFAIEKKDFEKIYEFSIDTLYWSHLKYGHTDKMLNFKLGTCCSQEDISITGAHRAMNDVEANTKLIIKYISDLRIDSNSSVQQKETRIREKFYF